MECLLFSGLLLVEHLLDDTSAACLSLPHNLTAPTLDGWSLLAQYLLPQQMPSCYGRPFQGRQGPPLQTRGGRELDQG